MPLFILVLIFSIFLPSQAAPFLNDTEIASTQAKIKDMPVGERIAFWAGLFIGTPYDTDPLGEYVSRAVVVADDRVDCMYLAFRSAELALTRSPEEAIEEALDKRFATRGKLNNETVLNYEERFEYAEDMLLSGKWGENVTEKVGPTATIEGSRGMKSVKIILKDDAAESSKNMESGDMIYFVKHPDKRVVGEIAGHLGIILRKGDKVFLIHASGRKGKGGEVKKAPFSDYVRDMSFAGIMVGRFRASL